MAAFCHFYSGSGQTADGPVPAGLQYALIVAILKEETLVLESGHSLNQLRLHHNDRNWVITDCPLTCLISLKRTDHGTALIDRQAGLLFCFKRLQ